MLHDNTFDKWLDSRVQDILNKAQHSSLSDSEMLTLVLKAQTNHFHHLDIEFRDEFKRLDNKFEDKFKQLDEKFATEFNRVDKRFDQLREEIKESFHRHDLAFEKHDYMFEKIDRRFEAVDRRFEAMDKKIDSRFLWTIGIMISGFAGIYLKLIFP